MGKTKFVENLSAGESFDDLLMVKSIQLRETRAGKPYCAIVFADKSGDVHGPVWEDVDRIQEICIPGSVVAVRGVVQTYNNALQLKIETIQSVTDDAYPRSDFIAASHRQAGTMEQELKQLVAGVRNNYLRKLLNQIFFTSDAGPKYLQSPAAKGIHHAYLGGLLEHSLSMAHICVLLSEHYDGLDKDLLVSGALLHDIGKIVELENSSGAIDYTEPGRLKGHLVIGCELIGVQAAKVKDFPEPLLTQLQHLVLSHHGRQEFGSPIVPMTAEALLLSFIDDMDAKMNLVQQLRRKINSKQMQWSEYQRSLERYLLLKPYDDHSEAQTESPDRAGMVKQQSLF